MSEARTDSPTATATGSGNGTPGSAPLTSRSPSSARAPTSRACLSPGAGTSGRCWRWSRRPYVHGVSTRAVDSLAEALGLKGISKDQVSRICKELDAQVHAFRTRPLDAEYPYLMLDATFEKVRENGRVISMVTRRSGTGSARTAERIG